VKDASSPFHPALSVMV